MFDRDNYLGQQIGNYLAVEKLGSGQFGTVYRAQNKLVAERIVAIKLINNKYVNSQEEALLADFGIAIEMPVTTVKNDATIIGTPPYMAPEQFQGTVSKLSDQ